MRFRGAEIGFRHLGPAVDIKKKTVESPCGAPSTVIYRMKKFFWFFTLICAFSEKVKC